MDSLSLHSNAAVLNLQHFSLWSKYCKFSTGVFIGPEQKKYFSSETGFHNFFIFEVGIVYKGFGFWF